MRTPLRSGQLVRIRGSRAHWTVIRDDGDLVSVGRRYRPRSIPPYAPGYANRRVRAAEIVARMDAGGWVYQ